MRPTRARRGRRRRRRPPRRPTHDSPRERERSRGAWNCNRRKCGSLLVPLELFHHDHLRTREVVTSMLPTVSPREIATRAGDAVCFSRERRILGEGCDRVAPSVLYGVAIIEPPERERRWFSTMHLIVIKKEILGRGPWVATSVYEAFVESRRFYREFMQQPHRLSFVWTRSKRSVSSLAEHDSVRRRAGDAPPSARGRGALRGEHERT